MYCVLTVNWISLVFIAFQVSLTVESEIIAFYLVVDYHKGNSILVSLQTTMKGYHEFIYVYTFLQIKYSRYNY